MKNWDVPLFSNVRRKKGMSANRSDLISQMNLLSTELLREKGYISFVDLLLRMGKLTQKDCEAWRNRKIP